MTEVHRQAIFNGGELGDRFLGRRDLKAYAASLSRAENMLPLPQGPIVRRPGLAHVDLIRNRLAPVALTAGMITAPNGGNPATLVAGEGFVTATPIGTANPHVLFEVDFGVAVEVGGFDLNSFAVTAGGDPLPDPTPPQYPWDPDRPEEVLP